jgi:hypothetical protein
MILEFVFAALFGYSATDHNIDYTKFNMPISNSQAVSSLSYNFWWIVPSQTTGEGSTAMLSSFILVYFPLLSTCFS